MCLTAVILGLLQHESQRCTELIVGAEAFASFPDRGMESDSIWLNQCYHCSLHHVQSKGQVPVGSLSATKHPAELQCVGGMKA